MRKKIELNAPYMSANPYLAIFYSFVDVNPLTITWLLKFFTGVYAYTKNEMNEFDMDLHGFIPANLLDDYFLVCCPFVEICNMNRNLITNDIISMLQNAILQGYCVSAVINPHYINAYGDIHLNEHNLLVNGFDTKRNVLYVKDFFAPTYKYVQIEIPYTEFCEAYIMGNKKYNLRFLRKKEMESVPSKSDLERILKEVLANLIKTDYHVGNPYRPLAYQVYNNQEGRRLCPKQVWYGIGVYSGMISKLGEISNKFWIMLRDSKRLIYYAISLLVIGNRDNVLQRYEEIIGNFERLMNLNIKFQITNNRNILIKMEKILRLNMNMELEVTKEMLEKI